MKRFVRITGMFAVLCMLMTGCSARNGMAMTDAYMPETMYAAEMDVEMEKVMMDSAVSLNTASGQETGAVAQNDLAQRKLIRNAELRVETKTYDTFTAALETQIASHGGYVQNGENNGSAERGNRWASYTLRIPENRYTSFLSAVSDLGTVTYRSENVQDVTMAYTDVEARIRSLETEHDTLLAILEKCENLDDVITVQSRITDVQYELDRYKSQMRRYDDLISYCTVHLYVDEVERVQIPVAEQTLGQRIVEDLRDNCEDIVEDAEDFAVWFVSSLPYFGIWLVVIGGAVLILRKKWKRRGSHRKQNADQDNPGEKD